MAFLDKTGLQTLTNKLVQGDAIKVASHRGRTIENVIDNITRECGNVPTPLEYKIENRVTDFRIGQGRDVDASGDVEKGYTEVELQGKTWQNLKKGEEYNYTQAGSSTQKGEYRTITEIQEGALGANILVGLKNSFPLLKPSTKYTIFFREVPSSSRWIIIREINANQNVFSGDFNRKNNSVSFTTTANYSGEVVVYYNRLKISDKVRISNNIVLIEGDHTQTPIEELPQYFEGIQSSFEDGVIDIDVVGKNLFKYEDVVKRTPNSIVEVGDDYVSITDEYYCGSMVKIDKNTRYYVSAIRQPIGDSNGGSISIFKSDGTGVQGATPIRALGKDNGYFDSGENEYISVLLYGGSAKRGTCIFRNVQIEKAGKITSYEPYYKKKISFNIDEPLRSLPNGTSDEIQCSNGQWELVRRIGKVVIDGSFMNLSNPPSYYTDNSTACLTNRVSNYKRVYGEILCESLSTYKPSEAIWAGNAGSTNKIGISGVDNYWDFAFRLKNSVTGVVQSDDPNATITKFRNYFNVNPTTVYYELAEPIITPIEPIKFETQPLGSIEINSEISPTSFHTVQLNRAGQIERAIVEIAELKNRVDILETMYDSYFLETSHKLELLGLDYELESEEF